MAKEYQGRTESGAIDEPCCTLTGLDHEGPHVSTVVEEGGLITVQFSQRVDAFAMTPEVAIKLANFLTSIAMAMIARN